MTVTSTLPRRRRGNQAGRPSHFQAQPHTELFSLERLEEFGQELASNHKEITGRVAARPLLADADKSGRTLENAYTRLASDPNRKSLSTPGDEWLLDNYHIVRDTVAEIQVDLPRRYYLQLPRLAEGPWTGCPRVYAAVREMILHTDGIVDTLNVEAFIRGYQSALPLNLGELWAVPAMIRLALVENLATLAQALLDAGNEMAAADSWADRILTMAEPLSASPGSVIAMPRELELDVAQITPTFVARLLQSMRDAGPAVTPVVAWIERELASAGSSPDEAVRIEFNRQATLQASVGNTISSMRRLSAANWADFVERQSAVEALLRTDPAGIYAKMDFATRDRYRHTVERIARRSGKSEISVAEQAVGLARAAKEGEREVDPGDLRRSHVGYYLAARGVHQLRAATGYRSRLGETLSRFIRAYPTTVYIGSILVVTLFVLGVALLLGFLSDGSSSFASPMSGVPSGPRTIVLRAYPLLAVVVLILAIFPASELASRVVNLAVTLLLPPRVLPKLDLSGGIPVEYSTFVAIPTLFRRMEDVETLLRHIEELYLANQDANLRLTILSDFADAPSEEMPGDADLLTAACEGVEALNSSYGGLSRFYLFHRKRQWNPREGVWMGWERKRGKLADFNALLRGQGGESFTTRVGDTAYLAATRYVITLDSDTDLPREAAHRLVGTLAHPLNRADLDPETHTVTTGYGILQPRVESTWESGGGTLFSRLASGHTGVDPYTTAVSNAYQDLFGEGIFIGKGIYDVDAFEEAIRGRFPKNAILSHDLLEGAYARAGLVSDITLYEGFPSRYSVFAARAHRWVRGDWQIASWVFPRVPTDGARERNPLTPINRWKIGDNLRRSLVAPASVLLLALGWALPAPSPIFWTAFILLVFAFPFYSHILTAIPRKPLNTSWARHLSSVSADALTNLLYLLMNLTFLAHTAYLMLDAVGRTLVRIFITHRHLLEWVTASESQRTQGTTPLDSLKRMWPAPLLSLLVGSALLLWRPEAAPVAALWLLAWLLSPLVDYQISKPTVPTTYTVTEAERLYLRRVARKSWRYFEEFVGERDHWLAPDNFQEYPKGEVAHRTSPTNLGLLFLSTLSAHDLGYITLSELVSRVDRTLLSMEGLEKYNGHLYNWYDTLTGQPLPPRYISTVDSGNLAGHLVVLKNGCEELLDAPLFSEALVQNLRDLIELMKAELTKLMSEHMRPLQASQRTTLSDIAARVETISVLVETHCNASLPHTLTDWVKLTGSLVQPASDLATEVRRLIGALGWGKGSQRDDNNPVYTSSSVDELACWTDTLVRAVQALDQEISNLIPWAAMLESPPELLTDNKQPEIASHWARLKKLPVPEGSSGPIASLSSMLAWCTGSIADIRRLRARIKDTQLGDEGAAALRWLEELGRRVSGSWVANEAAISKLNKLVTRADNLSRQMKFGFLYDEERKLFSIGYNVAELRRDNSYYDLLASEARLASYLAIARGDVPQSHWFSMGRPITGQGRDMALISWTGTMFEYLMPNLVMPSYSGSLLDQACIAAVRYQERHGRKRGVPWGISEAAYNALDSSENYRYRAFGLPELGLKRGLSDDLVVAPYATQLALGIDPQQALSNLRRLSSLGLEGRYGFYDSIDFTRSRLTSDAKGAIVETYMVHHLGMGLVAINNLLGQVSIQGGGQMVGRFEAEPEVRATTLLLQERIPREAPAIQPHPIEAGRERSEREEMPPVVRSYNTPNTDVARAHLISNGRYTVMITNSGAGYSRWGTGNSGLAVTRWRNDWVRDSYGSFIYVRDRQSGEVWSAAAAPFGGKPRGYNARFGLDKAEFFRRDGDIETHMEVVVSPEDDAEIRRVTLTNRGSRTRVLDLTSYAEIAFAPQPVDEAHPAFSKLFIETEYFGGHGALLASRRPRSAGEKRNWLLHVVAVSRPDGSTTGALGSPFPEEYETDRMAFLGRGGTPSAPRAMMPGQDLSNSEGAVLDPIFSLRQKVRVEPGMRVQVSFVTAASETKEEAYALSDKYHDPTWGERAIRMALVQARLELRMLDLSVDESMEYQRIFSRMIYPQRGTRPSEATLAKNSKGQPGLWAYGISGDFPILLVRIADTTEAPLVSQALHAHEFWQRNGFEADLVILNEYPGGYMQPVQDMLERLVAASHAHQMLNKPGGVYVKRADIMPDADRILLNSVARVVLVGSRGTLAIQLDREIPDTPLPPLRTRNEVADGRTGTARSASNPFVRPASSGLNVPVPTRLPKPAQAPALPLQAAFSPDGREYVITLTAGVWTPLPWSNVIANQRFGCLVTESGMASTWSGNSRENRLTPWSNDPVSDPPSEVIYIRDEESGAVSSPTPLPIRDSEPYTVRHGQGYTTYSHTGNGIEQTLRVSVPPDDSVKVCKLTLRNQSGATRKLSVTYYAELVMGVSREGTSRYIVTEGDRRAVSPGRKVGAGTGAIFARNPYNNEFAERIAFATTSAESFTFTTDRAEFIGRNGSTQDPIALKRRSLSGRVGAGLDPCFALQCPLDLQPGEERSITFTLGEGDNADQARLLAAKYSDAGQAEAEYRGTLATWDQLLSAVVVQTPDLGLNLLMNRWILYQSVSCRIWGRTAFYQSGGAYGFRDQLQDVMALVYAAPQIAREQILRCAARQFKEGDVQHWWHPPTGRGVRTRFSDDLLWLPFVTAYYIQATGDTQILEETLPFLQAPLLNPDQEDMYSTPTLSDEVASVYEHCLRAIERGTTAGAHGLPLMGGGDWNDGMNKVGIGGKGESVWVGWFLYATLAGFVPLCERRGDSEHAATFRDAMTRLKEALESQAWDGEWYLRAFYDNSEPMGSAKSEECRIDSIAQSWSVISGAAGKERAARAMQSVEEQLVLDQEKMILLLTPPFDKSSQDPGYIKGYLPGVRENGGQYTHAAIWTAIAHAMQGDGEGAYRLFEMLSPLNHTHTAEETARYMVEPYVIAADIYSHPQHTGRGGWTWYTGSASWFYRLGVEYILGLKLHGDHFTIEPRIPPNWPGYSMTYRYRTSSYHISVENPNSGMCCVQAIELDGSVLPSQEVPLVDDGRKHEVRVVICAGEGGQNQG
jgi:cyclic beta-1,2-glucan synthetase